MTMIANPIDQTIDDDELIDLTKPWDEQPSWVLVDHPGINVFMTACVLEAYWELGADGQAKPGVHPHLHGFEVMSEPEEFYCPYRDTYVRVAEVTPLSMLEEMVSTRP